MKKIILFAQLMVLSCIPYLDGMDTQTSKDERLHQLIEKYLTTRSIDIPKIKFYIINSKTNINRDLSLLYKAINYGNVPLVQLFIEQGANLLLSLPNGSMPLQHSYQKAKTQNNENDLIQVQMGYQKPEYKKVFLYLLSHIMQNEELFYACIDQAILTLQMVEFALPLAREYNQLQLVQVLQDSLQKESNESD